MFSHNVLVHSLVVDVTLLGGKSVSLEADLDASVETLQKCARRALGVGTRRLIHAFGSHAATTLAKAGLRTRDSLTLCIRQILISVGCFAAMPGDGFVVTRGLAYYGGDSSLLNTV